MKYALSIFLIVLAVYFPAWNFEMLRYDDHQYVEENEHMRDGLTAGNVHWAITSCGYASNWHPLTWLSLMGDVSVRKALGANHVIGDAEWKLPASRLSRIMHLHNIVLHAANAVLLFALCCLLASRARGDLIEVALPTGDESGDVIDVALPADGRAGSTSPPHPAHGNRHKAHGTKHQASGVQHYLLLSLLVLLWALHPLRNEVVCWVTERKELLSAFFMLLSLICYIVPRAAGFMPRAAGCIEPALPLGDESGALGDRALPADGRAGSMSPPHPAHGTRHKAPSTFFLALSLLFFALALAAKPVAVTMPAILFAWDWIMHGKIRWGRVSAFMVLSLGAAYLTLISQTEAVETGESLSVMSHVASVIHAPIIYLKQTFYPVGLSVLYPHTRALDPVLTTLGILLVLVVLAVGIWWLILFCAPHQTPSASHQPPSTPHQALRTLLFAVAWCYIGLIPMLGVVKVGPMEHSDRYTYWVTCGLIATLAFLYGCIRPHVPNLRAWLKTQNDGRDEWRLYAGGVLGGLLALVLVLTFLTRVDMSRWQGTIPLFRDALPKFWNVEVAEVLTNELQKRGLDKEAEFWLRKSATHTRNPQTLLNLATFLLKKPPSEVALILGRDPYTEPKMLLDEALRMEPTNKRGLELKDEIEKAEKKMEKKN